MGMTETEIKTALISEDDKFVRIHAACVSISLSTLCVRHCALLTGHPVSASPCPASALAARARRAFTRPKPSLSYVAVNRGPQIFDLCGFIVIRNALSEDEVAVLNAAVDHHLILSDPQP